MQAIREVADGGSFFTPSVAKSFTEFSAAATAGRIYTAYRQGKEILKLLVDGLSYKMIADKVSLSFHTIHTHLRNIYEKLHVNSKGEAINKAMKNKLV